MEKDYEIRDYQVYWYNDECVHVYKAPDGRYMVFADDLGCITSGIGHRQNIIRGIADKDITWLYGIYGGEPIGSAGLCAIELDAAITAVARMRTPEAARLHEWMVKLLIPSILSERPLIGITPQEHAKVKQGFRDALGRI